MAERDLKKFDQHVRLKCLQMVMENGSNINRATPIKRAQELYDWVTGRTATTAPVEPTDESGQPLAGSEKASKT